MSLEELTRELIRVETVSPVEDGEKFRVIKKFLSERGLEYEIKTSEGVKSLVARRGQGRPHICLCGHLDVVPVDKGWEKTDPYTPKVEDGKLYGRGASDMKSGLAAQMRIFHELGESEDFEGSLTLMVPGDEELGGWNGATSLLEEYSDYDLALIAEPTDMKIQKGFRGKIHLNVYLKGEGTHASRPHLVENVLEDLPATIEELSSLKWPDDSTDLPETTSVITKIESGNPQNSIPSRVRIGMDIRNDTATDYSEAERRIIEALPSGLDFEVQLDHRKPEVMVEDREILEALIEAYEDVKDRSPVITTEGGSSDGAHFSTHGVPSVEIGPQQGPIHGPDEYCELEDVRDMKEIMKDACMRLSSRKK
jgi:succinyl-diaminopimelate desuccinylase